MAEPTDKKTTDDEKYDIDEWNRVHRAQHEQLGDDISEALSHKDSMRRHYSEEDYKKYFDNPDWDKDDEESESGEKEKD